MKAGVYSITGKKIKEVELPPVFETQFKPKLVKRVVVALDSKRYQPKGTKPDAGMDTSAEYIGRRRAYRTGIGVGSSRLPRIKPGGGGLGRVAKVPQAVGGRRAHPPKVEKKIVKKVNKKEKKAALEACIAATANKELVKRRGYLLDGIKELPIIVESKFEEIKKTKEAKAALERLGLGPELENEKRILIVASQDLKSCRNIPGVYITNVDSLSPLILAPGTHAGVLTVWTENAIKKLSERYGS